ncbi:MAG: TonB-dependent receptor plug domain-containing protein [Bacteroidetes bacterium]|nr:TonB-dependent receptor plug domain-containing protein [Bacteroidota bacterium]
MKSFLFKNIMVIAFALIPSAMLFSQEELIQVSGTVLDVDNKLPLPGANVLIKNTETGTVADEKGQFELTTCLKFPFTIIISSVGFETREIEVLNSQSPISIALNTQNILAKEVVISASRVEERILQSPVAIEKLDIRAIRETPAPSFYDALENVKGVQMLTSSLTFKVPNTRGFNVPNNFRFMQLVDGVDMQASTLGVPIGNAIGPTELDILAVEITPGAASALYGMNAINGLATMQTKSPFVHQGLSVYQKTGVNHVDGIDRDPSPLTETAVRFAKAFNDKFAFKLNASYLHGTDWIADTQNDQNPQNKPTANPNFPELSGENNPAADYWSTYADDRQARSNITIDYKGQPETFIVARTGYQEKDLVHPDVSNLKFDGGLYYRFTPKTEINYGYRFGQMDGVFQRGNRIQLDNVQVQNHKLELRSTNLTVRAYALLETTGNSYNLNPLAYSLDLSHASNAVWAGVFKEELQKQVDADVPLADAMKLARIAADAGRAEPGTKEFEELKNTIVKSNNWDHIANLPTGAPNGGAALLQKSRTYHTDFQYNLSQVKWADIILGGDYRRYVVIPDGNTFVDFDRPVAERSTPLADGSFGENQIYQKVGGFVQLTKLFFDKKLKLNTSGRLDYNPEFSAKFNPRVALVYSPIETQNFRVSYQNGFRFPALFEAFSFLNNASVRRVGGLARVNEGIGYNENSYTLASIDLFNAAVNADVKTGLTKEEAALKNRNILEVSNLKSMQPERINSFEVGYKSLIFKNKISIDWDAYYNIYDGFLGQVEVAVPKSGSLVGSDEAVIDMLTRSKQDRYRVYTNAKNTYHSYGSSLGLTWNFFKKYTLSGNVNYNDIKANEQKDVFLNSFNTPLWVTNLSFGNREVAKNIGFNIVWRWQDEVNWESTLANGKVPAISTFDAQINFRIPTWKSIIKVGGTDIFNKRYYQYAAGPTLGGLYYVALTVEGAFN